MKVLFYSAYLYTPHFETELEIISNLKSDGHQVFVLGCKGQLPSCELNPSHKKHLCVICRSKFLQGMKAVGISERQMLDFPKIEVDYHNIPATFSNIDELMKFSIDECNIGRGAASSLITRMCRDPKLNTHKYAKEIRTELHASLLVLRSLEKLIEEIKPEAIYLFNGRFATYFPVVELCRKLGLPFVTHERGADKSRYLLRRSELPHDIEYANREMLEIWEHGPENKEEIASHWYKQRRNGAEQSWHSFIKHQNIGKLPQRFDSEKRNITIFSSTMDEVAVIPGWENPFFKDELEALHLILTEFGSDPDIRFHLRMHPSMVGIPRETNYQLSEVAKLGQKYPQLNIIWPESRVHSYELLEKSEKNLTFGSTIGAESCFWGKPNILVGRSFYESLRVSHYPKDFSELCHMLKDPKLPPLDKTGALIYAYWEARKGTEFKRFSPNGLFGGTFEGDVIQPATLAVAWATFLKWTQPSNIGRAWIKTKRAIANLRGKYREDD